MAPFPLPRKEKFSVEIERRNSEVYSAVAMEALQRKIFGRIHGELGRY
jgi:hypothetical protein